MSGEEKHYITFQSISGVMGERNRLVAYLVSLGWVQNHDFFEPPERLVTDSTKQELYTLDRAVIREIESKL